MNSVKKMLGALFLAFYVVSTSGCFALVVGAAAGAGGMIWAKGKLRKDFAASLDRTHKAALSALKKMELPIVVDRKDQLTAKLESKFADGATVWIDMDTVTSKTTRVDVRVGTMGDQVRSQEILDLIEKSL